MMNSPQNHTERPDEVDGLSDPMADQIEALRLVPEVEGVFELAVPFAVQLPNSHALGRCGNPDLRLLSVVRGSASVHIEGREPLALSAGDLLVLSRTLAVELRDAPDTPARPEPLAFDADGVPKGYLAGGAASPLPTGAHTRWIGVGFRLSPIARESLLAHLPPVLYAAADANPTLAAAASLLRAEASHSRPARRVVLGRLGEIALIELLRSEGEREASRCGELKGLSDPQLARAIARVHANPAADWTIESLGKAAGLSRSAFAARFQAKMGEAPLQYVTRWRMTKAAMLLTDSRAPLLDVAEQVGYQSEAAFSRAFVRVQGQTPAAFRRAGRAG